MSGLLNSSINGSASNMTDSAGRSYPSSYSAQSGAGSTVFHHTGTIQGLQNMHGSFNIPNMTGTFTSRSSTINGMPSGGMQQSAGNLPTGRFGSNSLPAALSQISHAGSHGHSGVTNRGGMNIVGSPYNSNTNGVGGSIPGVLPTSGSIGNRGAIPGLGVSPILANAGSRITSSMGNMAGAGNIGRNISSGGGLSMPGLNSRLNLTSNNSGNLSLQGPNRLMSGVLTQASPQVMSMLGNSYASGGGPLSQSLVQNNNNLSSMSMLNDVNSNDTSPFGLDDFPTLTSRPNSAGGPHGQIGPMRKQGLGPIVQQNQEFSIQNEDFPALPGYKGGNDYGMDLNQKDQIHDTSMSMMQNHQHFSMGRSTGFSLGASYSSHRSQQQQQMPSVSGSSVSFGPVNNQDLLQLHGSDRFPSSNSTYHIQGSGPPENGLRSMNSLSTISGMGSFEQQMQQYQQQQQSPSQQFRLRQMSEVSNQPVRDQQGINSVRSTQQSLHSQSQAAAPDRFGIMGLSSVIKMSNPDVTSLALGLDLMSLGLNLNSAVDLHKTFGSPFSDKPLKGDPEFAVPQCYHAKPPPELNPSYFMKFSLETLFYIFYSMPKDEAQLCAAHELYRRGWFYHKELRAWLARVPNVEPLVKTATYERGSYVSFDVNTWDKTLMDNYVLQYELIEKRPPLPQVAAF